MIDKYILKDKVAIPTDDLLEWARNFEGANRHVARTEVRPGLVVSTVFLGLDHSFGDGPPLLFETMTFEGGDEINCERTSTWVEAELAHMAEAERRGG